MKCGNRQTLFSKSREYGVGPVRQFNRDEQLWDQKLLW